MTPRSRSFIIPSVSLGNIGAGGNWSCDDETPDPTMEMQAGPFHCFAACAVAVLRQSNAILLQQQIAAALGVPTPWNDRMTGELNRRDKNFNWIRGWLDPDYPAEAAAFLAGRLPAILFLKDFGSRHLHAVVLAAFDSQDRWVIRDPWKTKGHATRYSMRLEYLADALHGWTGLAVYRDKPKKGQLRHPK
jgi:hypothetical protein